MLWNSYIMNVVYILIYKFNCVLKNDHTEIPVIHFNATMLIHPIIHAMSPNNYYRGVIDIILYLTNTLHSDYSTIFKTKMYHSFYKIEAVNVFLFYFFFLILVIN